MQVITLPVWSKLAREEGIPLEVARRLPAGWRLSQHQVETYKALTSGKADVIFNTAMTGDGKSLAGQLPILIHCDRPSLMAMYPTNELVADQEGQLAKAAAQWAANLQFHPLNSAELDAIMATDDYTQRGEALMGVLRNNDVVLTNPDIFHLIMQQFYRYPADAPDKLIGPLVQRVGQFTFDEFHIFEVPQVLSVLNAALFIHEMSGPARPHRFLFLSATPRCSDPLKLDSYEPMQEYLHRSGLNVQEITGQYAHGEIPPDRSQWRRILNSATIHFDSLRAEEWVERHLDDILLPFFLGHRPGAKGAIIVNSVAAANRLLNRLRPALAVHGLTVEPNTGLTSRPRRAASYGADLLIGTSTIDVGVDFQINFMLFESRDANSFLQRLGRLGRHPGYERGGLFYPFDEFAAYALVPEWVKEALFAGRDGAAPLLHNGEAINRERLNTSIQEAYPPTASFEAYARLWGELQAVRVMIGLSDPTIKEQYAETRARLGKRYEETFGIQLRPAFGRYQVLKAEQRPLLDEAISFRGQSYFTCCVIDETEEGAAQFKAADLFQLVSNANLGLVDEQAFYLAAEQAGLARRIFERQEPLAFFRMYGWRDEREEYRLVLDRDIRSWGADRFGKAVVLKGFKLDASTPGLMDLNNRLCRRELPALLCLGYHPLELKRRLRLPLLFAVYAFESRDGVGGCVTFGREALMLEARLQHTRLNCGTGPIIL